MAKRCISNLSLMLDAHKNVRACELSYWVTPVPPAPALSLGVWVPCAGQGNLGRRMVLGTPVCELFNQAVGNRVSRGEPRTLGVERSERLSRGDNAGSQARS